MAFMDKLPVIWHVLTSKGFSMFGDKAKSLPQRVALILVPQFTMMPVTSAIEPLRLANRISNKKLYDWTASPLPHRTVLSPW
jgi:hypothetical protein